MTTRGPYDATDDYPHEQSYGYQKWLKQQKPVRDSSWKKPRFDD